MKKKYLKIGAIVVGVILVLVIVFLVLGRSKPVHQDGHGNDVQISEEEDKKENQEESIDQYHDVELEDSNDTKPQGEKPNNTKPQGEKPNNTKPETPNSSQETGKPSGTGNEDLKKPSQGGEESNSPSEEEIEPALPNGTIKLPTDVFE